MKGTPGIWDGWTKGHLSLVHIAGSKSRRVGLCQGCHLAEILVIIFMDGNPRSSQAGRGQV